MFDRRATALIKPGVNRMATVLSGWGVGANTLTWVGFAIGLGAAALIASGHFRTAIAAILLSRLMDALDGAVARLTRATDAGGFLDITLDFLFYASIPLAFALADPPANALAAAVLLTAFVGTMSSFLAFAVLAAKRNMDNLSVPDKSFYFLGGLTEAAETLLLFVLMCLWPMHFDVLAYSFAVL